MQGEGTRLLHSMPGCLSRHGASTWPRRSIHLCFCLACAQGHFQIMFNYQHCPLFQSKLSFWFRLMYSSEPLHCPRPDGLACSALLPANSAAWTVHARHQTQRMRSHCQMALHVQAATCTCGMLGDRQIGDGAQRSTGPRTISADAAHLHAQSARPLCMQAACGATWWAPSARPPSSSSPASPSGSASSPSSLASGPRWASPSTTSPPTWCALPPAVLLACNSHARLHSAPDLANPCAACLVGHTGIPTRTSTLPRKRSASRGIDRFQNVAADVAMSKSHATRRCCTTCAPCTTSRRCGSPTSPTSSCGAPLAPAHPSTCKTYAHAQ